MKHKIKLAPLLLVAFALLAFSCNRGDKAKLLVGDWVRTDAPYQIQITEALADGELKAAYFNPQSINVGKAEWKEEDGVVKIYVELRDVNYPGSNYNLIYLPEKDMLTGNYFQAVEGTTYEVAFARKK